MTLIETTYCTNNTDELFMLKALDLAKLASQNQEVPIGALVVQSESNQIVGQGANSLIADCDCTAHAEIVALRQACQHVRNYRLGQLFTMYVTLMPCMMCLGAILNARIGRIVVGCEDSRYGLNKTQLIALFNQNPLAWGSCQLETGCLKQESKELLQIFFKARRQGIEATLQHLNSLSDLPNLSREIVHWLNQQGYRCGKDLITPNATTVVQQLECLIASDVSLNQKQKAMLQALCYYLKGYGQRSWRDFLILE